MKSDTKNNQIDFEGNSEVRKINSNCYNFILPKALKGLEGENFQYIIQVEDTIGIASLNPLTEEDIQGLNLEEWNFRPFKELVEEWESKRNKSKEVQS